MLTLTVNMLFYHFAQVLRDELQMGNSARMLFVTPTS